MDLFLFCVIYLSTETHLLFSALDLDKSPFSSAYLSGRNRESDANNLLGAVSKLFILWAKYVYWNLSFSGVAATLHTWKQEYRSIKADGIAESEANKEIIEKK